MARRRKPAKKHVVLLNKARPFYEQMLEAQGGRCGICGRPHIAGRRRFDIDHDHKGMYIRGLLCSRCNRALPGWMDSVWLRSAADYLDRGPVPWLSL